MKNKGLLSLLLCLLLCITAILALSACSGEPDEPQDLPKIEGVTFSDASYVYDGTEKSISVVGAPAGAEVTYSPGNTFTARGTYTIKATVKLEGYQDLVLTAKLTITNPVVDNTVTVSFDTKGGSAIDAVKLEKGESLSAPANPYKKGYEFQGWFNGNYKYDFSKTVSEPMTLTAKWKLISYEITYDLVFGTNSPNNPSTYTIESEEIVLEPATAIAGSEFDYWYIMVNGAEQKITSIATGTDGNIRIYAKYRYEDFAITYVLGGGENNPDNPATSNVGQAEVVLLAATLRGYDFIGWFTTEGCDAASRIEKLQHLNAPITLYAKFAPATYTITYAGVNAGELPSGATATYTLNDTVTFPTLSDRTDYTFGGWLDAASQPTVGIALNSVGNVTVTANWIPKTYNITYNLGNGTNNSQNPATFTVETPTITLLNPSRDYYTFAGWTNASGDPVTEIALGTSGDVTLNASWTPVQYPINYMLGGGENDSENPATYSVEDEFTLEAATKTGFKFLGWFTENNVTSTNVTEITLGSHGEITLYAQWEEYDASIVYNAMGGTLPKGNPTGYDPTVGVASFLPATKAGYTFEGWYTNPEFTGDKVQSIAVGTEADFTLYARFVYGSAGLSYTANGSTYTVSGYNGTDTVVNIPEEYNGKPVTAIADNAFKNNTNIISVIIPDSVSTIGANAFAGCTALDTVVIPVSVTTVGAEAFFGCTALDVIYCEAASKPAGYADTFNKLDASESINVVWGYKDADDGVMPPLPFA